MAGVDGTVPAIADRPRRRTRREQTNEEVLFEVLFQIAGDIRALKHLPTGSWASMSS